MPRIISGMALLLAWNTAALAQDKPGASSVGTQAGSDIFRVYCSSCHGKEAKGDGPVASALRVRPPDLTLLAKHSDGKFQADKIRRIVDGRDPVKGHGGGDMPIWGDAFKSAADGYGDAAVKDKVDRVVAYLESIQERDSK
ncbi:MAG: c-type cytochrome [Vicinamibacteria bacterium]